MAQRRSRHPQRRGHPSASAVPLLLFYRFACAGWLVRRQCDMRNELLLGGKTAQIWPVFAEYDLDRFHPDRVDPRQIHSAHPVQSLAHRLCSSALDRSPFLWVLRLRHFWAPALLTLHLRQLLQDLLLIVGDPLLDGVVHLQSLPQAEQMILAPVPAQLLGNLLFALVAAPVPQFRQLPRVPLSVDDRPQDGHSRYPVDVRYGPVHSHVHLVQALLHPPQPIACLRHQVSFVAYQGPKHTYRFLRPDRAHQQPATVQPLNPFTVERIRLLIVPWHAG